MLATVLAPRCTLEVWLAIFKHEKRLLSLARRAVPDLRSASPSAALLENMVPCLAVASGSSLSRWQ